MCVCVCVQECCCWIIDALGWRWTGRERERDKGKEEEKEEKDKDEQTAPIFTPSQSPSPNDQCYLWELSSQQQINSAGNTLEWGVYPESSDLDNTGREAHNRRKQINKCIITGLSFVLESSCELKCGGTREKWSVTRVDVGGALTAGVFDGDGWEWKWQVHDCVSHLSRDLCRGLRRRSLWGFEVKRLLFWFSVGPGTEGKTSVKNISLNVFIYCF